MELMHHVGVPSFGGPIYKRRPLQKTSGHLWFKRSLGEYGGVSICSTSAPCLYFLLPFHLFVFVVVATGWNHLLGKLTSVLTNANPK